METGSLAARELSIERSEFFSLRLSALRVMPGEVLSVMGPNGAGKSTLLRVLAGLLPRSGGDLDFEGCDPKRDRAVYSARLHYLGHKDGVKTAFTVSETVRFWAALLGQGGGDAPAALQTFGLSNLGDVPAAFLSAGQRRRLALARLLVAPRPLWLLDEPAAGLDAASRAALASALSRHRREGGIVILASHGELDLPDARVLRLGMAG